MKKFVISFYLIGAVVSLFAQETVLPAKEQKGSYFLTNATIHVGNGKVINNGTIKVTNGKIEAVGDNIAIPAGADNVTDLKGQDLYSKEFDTKEEKLIRDFIRKYPLEKIIEYYQKYK